MSTARRLEAIAPPPGLDPLTGLLGPDAVVDELNAALRRGGPVCLVRLDLDGFAELRARDGDGVLRGVGRVLASVLGPDAPLGRLDGDVFAAVLPGRDERAGRRMAHRLQRALGEPSAARPGGALTAGVGLSWAPAHGRDAQRLLRAAELALLAAKEDGAAQLRCYDEQLGERADYLGRLRSALWGAVQREAIGLHFQPIVDLRTGTTAGFEALARWRCAELGAVRPDDFLAVAKRCGLLAPLERQLVRRSIDALAAWPAGPWLAVNLSPDAVADPTLPDRLELLLASRGVAGERLHIEVTETSMVTRADATRAALDRIRALGCRVYLDDFGTGFSSLHHLDAFPLDGLKIDRSFVSRMTVEPRTRRIVDGILALARSLGMAVVAEGLEEIDQLAALAEQGCPLGQGWLFSSAVRPDEAPGLFGARWPTAV